jgi:predicted PurR-regulated permease PerM
MLDGMEERVVLFRPRAILVVIGIVLATVLLILFLREVWSVMLWMLIALFLATALNPAVEFLLRHGVKRRGAAVGIVFVAAIAAIAAIGATFIPTLVNEINDFAKAVPDYIEDLTKGRGPLGFLEREHHIVERVRDAINKSGVGGLLGLSSTALTITKSIVNTIIATVTIAFLTLFMLLEGPNWIERLYSLLPEERRPRWRKVGYDVYRTVGGYVAGNLAISLIAGVVTAVALLILDVNYAFALALLVALLDLIPLAGATIAAIVVSTVAFLDSPTKGIIILVFMILYQQFENHVLQPVIYGKAVQLSPLVVLIAVLLGAQLAGIIGALGAIPVAGAIQVLVLDWQEQRREKRRVLANEPPPGAV